MEILIAKLMSRLIEAQLSEPSEVFRREWEALPKNERSNGPLGWARTIR